MRGRLATAGEDPLYRGVLWGAAGLVGFYLTQIALYALGIPWRAVTLADAFGLLALTAHFLCRKEAAPAAGRIAPGWGDALALLTLAILTFCAVQMWMVYSDFIFHWGIKGQRFFLARGFDFEFLIQPWNWQRHPEYPNLFPSLFAATAAFAGGFREPAMMLWTAIFFFALLAAARETLRAAQVSRPAAQATMALLGLGAAMFGIGYTMGGSPDWVIALVPVAAWPLLLRRPDRASDLAVGWLAALAAAVKIEGVPLAAFLIGVYLLHRGRGWWRALPAVALPPALVVGAWLAYGWHHGLLGGQGERALSLRFAGTILRAALESLAAPEWHGAAFLVLLLPALLFCRPARPAALVASLQLLFYLYIYFSTPHPSAGSADFFVRSNLARLAFHLWPVALLGSGVALDRWARKGDHEGRPYGQTGSREPV